MPRKRRKERLTNDSDLRKPFTLSHLPLDCCRRCHTNVAAADPGVARIKMLVENGNGGKLIVKGAICDRCLSSLVTDVEKFKAGFQGLSLEQQEEAVKFSAANGRDFFLDETLRELKLIEDDEFACLAERKTSLGNGHKLPKIPLAERYEK